MQQRYIVIMANNRNFYAETRAEENRTKFERCNQIYEELGERSGLIFKKNFVKEMWLPWHQSGCGSFAADYVLCSKIGQYKEELVNTSLLLYCMHF